MFLNVLSRIFEVSKKDFGSAVAELTEDISSVDCFDDVLGQIGTIPESIIHDSTEEKLFSKVSDLVLARAFREIGLKSVVIRERADSADVLVESLYHGYTMVADAKAFRLSRTAKNQKDFKVVALSGWRNDADYAVLCSPYFHYPKSQSQIYSQSLEHNVCLLSWEHLMLMVRSGIKEDEELCLAPIWDFARVHASSVLMSERKRCFLKQFSQYLSTYVGLTLSDFESMLSNQISAIRKRSEIEIGYWESERDIIRKYTKEQAIQELLRSLRIDDKIRQIEHYAKGLRYD